MVGSLRQAGALSRWPVAVSVPLAVFVVTWWAWEALALPPAGPDQLDRTGRCRGAERGICWPAYRVGRP